MCSDWGKTLTCLIFSNDDDALRYDDDDFPVLTMTMRFATMTMTSLF